MLKYMLKEGVGLVTIIKNMAAKACNALPLPIKKSKKKVERF
jgi:hypothetical protein